MNCFQLLIPKIKKELIIILKTAMNSFKALIKLEENFIAQDKINRSLCKGPFKISQLSGNACQESPKISEWSIVQNVKYAVFIEQNCQKMAGKPHGKLWSLYQNMAKLIRTRNFRQCKLHHQRLSNEIGSIPDILAYLLNTIPEFQVLFSKEKEIQKLVSESAISCFRKSGQIQLKASEKLNKEDMVATDIAYRSDDAETEKFESEKKIMFPQMMAQQNHNWGQSKNSMDSEKWKECHNYFMEWTNRLNELMIPQIDY